MGYIDGSCPQPAAVISINNVDKTNPAFSYWFRQDQLIFGALVGTLSPNLISLISNSTTSKELWDKLAHTFNKISRGVILNKRKINSSHLKRFFVHNRVYALDQIYCP